MKDKLVPWKSRDVSLRGQYDEYPFDRLHREINALFDSYYRGFGKPWEIDARSGVEVSETDKEIRIKAELPGMDEKDIEVFLDEEVLIIHAERKAEHEEKKRNYQISEMSYGSFHRRFPLDAAVDRERIKARFKQGVLTLTLPKTEQTKTERKKIPISTG